jgi:hypothetical protein
MVRCVASLWMVLLVCAGHAAYNARLYFRDATTGDSGTGQVTAKPGDLIEVWFSFHKIDTVNPYKWGTLQITLCFDGYGIVNQADKDAWVSSLNAARSSGGPTSDFLSFIPYEGELFDYAIDPTDVDGGPRVCNDGAYLLAGMRATASRSEAWDARLWQFTVQAEGVGETLNWLFDGRSTNRGLSTRILDQKNATVDVTDNWVTVVPEPDAWALRYFPV